MAPNKLSIYPSPAHRVNWPGLPSPASPSTFRPRTYFAEASGGARPDRHSVAHRLGVIPTGSVPVPRSMRLAVSHLGSRPGSQVYQSLLGYDFIILGQPLLERDAELLEVPRYKLPVSSYKTPSSSRS